MALEVPAPSPAAAGRHSQGVSWRCSEKGGCRDGWVQKSNRLQGKQPNLENKDVRAWKQSSHLWGQVLAPARAVWAQWGEVEVEENAFPLCIHLSHGWGSSCHHPYLCSSSIFIYLCLNLREEGGDVSSSLLLVGPFWFGACLRVPCNSVLLFSALKKNPRLIFSFPTDPGA